MRSLRILEDGVIALTRLLAFEWWPFGICTNTLAPGFIQTPFNQLILADPARMERIFIRNHFGQVLPDNALVGKALFLASEASYWLNAHTLKKVDAGDNTT